MSESGFAIGTAVAASVASHIMQPDTLVSQILAIGMGIVIGGPTGSVIEDLYTEREKLRRERAKYELSP